MIKWKFRALPASAARAHLAPLWETPGQCFMLSNRRKNFTNQTLAKLATLRQLAGRPKGKSVEITPRFRHNNTRRGR